MELLPQTGILMVELLQLLLEAGKIVVVGLPLQSLEVLPELILLNFKVTNFFHSFLIALLPGPLPLVEVEFVREGDGVVVVVDGADVLQKVVEVLLLLPMAMHDI